MPPWLVARTLTVPQLYGLWHGESDEGLTHERQVARANRVRRKRGLPPLSDDLPPGLTPEMAEANLRRAAELRAGRPAGQPTEGA